MDTDNENMGERSLRIGVANALRNMFHKYNSLFVVGELSLMHIQ
jgi:hypothetical protein